MERINTTVEVSIYQVKDEQGNEYPFSADTDGDGDIIITLTEVTPNDLESVKDFAMDNMDELIKDSCEAGLRSCIHAIMKHQPELFKQAVEYYE